MQLYNALFIDIQGGILRNPDSDPHSKKIRTREKPGPGLEKNPDSCLKKSGLDFWTDPDSKYKKTDSKQGLCVRECKGFLERFNNDKWWSLINKFLECCSLSGVVLIKNLSCIGNNSRICAKICLSSQKRSCLETISLHDCCNYSRQRDDGKGKICRSTDALLQWTAHFSTCIS
jgi:hypothetical protein